MKTGKDGPEKNYRVTPSTQETTVAGYLAYCRKSHIIPSSKLAGEIRATLIPRCLDWSTGIAVQERAIVKRAEAVKT